MPQQVFFAHANGFPSATYGKLFAILAPEFQVAFLPHQVSCVTQLPLGESFKMPGGHMFAPERPQATAQFLKGLFSCWQSQYGESECA
jgi:hypothetical protein